MHTIPIDKEELIVRLLVEDFRFQQIIHQMSEINFHFDQSLDIMSLISDLMHQNEQEPSIYWLHEYAEGLEAAYETEFWNESALNEVARQVLQRLNTKLAS